MHNFENLADNTETLITSIPSKLIRVVINKKGATSNVLSLYDGADVNGRIIATIDTTVSVGTFDFDVLCPKGLYAKMATGTAADVTIVYN